MTFGKMNALKTSIRTSNVTLVTTALAVAAVFSACTIRTPTTETPVPNDRGVEKSFFVEKTAVASAQGGQTAALKPKTFLCGWAPISETGAMASAYLTHAVHMAGHCNMEFELTESALIGRLVNPSFPTDRTRWKQALTIPIRKHYYYERSKDSYGRDTNEFIENTSRSHWSARPMIDLNLEGITIHDWDLAMFWNARSGVVTNVSDVEWDKENGFLGFTASIQNSLYGSDLGARIRFNFKAFEHNPSFQSTPYSPQNAKHLNALHIIGEKIEGLTQVWSAAKWDLSKTHDVYLHGFPPEYVPVAQKVVDLWNDGFEKIGKPRAFRLNKKPMKHPFDLRYPMMVWVDDPQISAYSPLGVGMAQSDVRNGEIVWGQITLYGGMLERYVKSYLGPIGSMSPTAQSAGGSFAPSFFQTYFNPTQALDLPPSLGGEVRSSTDRQSPLTGVMASNRLMEKTLEAITSKASPNGEKTAATNTQIEQARSESLHMAREMNTSLQKLLSEIQTRTNRDGFRHDTARMFGFVGTPSEEMRRQMFGSNEHIMSLDAKIQQINNVSAEKLKKASSGVVHDTDRRFIDIGPSIVSALAQTNLSYEEGLRKIILELVLHEYGHFLGLGHQFKENILPADGSVPKKYLAELKRDMKNNMTNSTSVMGYKHPVTELLKDDSNAG
ncbi:MAG: hypothetical protein RBT63_08025, partial [Bdellovibrionales bacterium]|nr:hypothetical protein [Bdellovibrionales bacterium]